MNRRYIFGFIFTIALLFSSTDVIATDQRVVISAVQTGDTVSASNEFIEIYNNSTSAVDVTGWCFYYMNAAQSHSAKLACFSGSTSDVRIYIPSKAYAVAFSSLYQSTMPNVVANLQFSATLAQASGHVKLLDGNGLEIDRLGWGVNALGPETLYAESAGPGFMMHRSMFDNEFVDTNNNSLDFSIAPSRMVFDGRYLFEVSDSCKNIDGFQFDIPDGYIADEYAFCGSIDIDYCTNLEGPQFTVPDGLMADAGECYQDVCHNVNGLQQTIPEGYEATDFLCTHDLLSLTLTELHPNPTGGDAGHEFIEIYNPNGESVSLNGYVIVVGNDDNYRIIFTKNDGIEPYSYKTIYNSAAAFTLVNTSSIVKILSADRLDVIDQTVQYLNPREGESWALIDGI